jgi:hypothetical protein
MTTRTGRILAEVRHGFELLLFYSAIYTQNSISAPGKDSVLADLLFSTPLIKAPLFALLNACVLLCFFPNSWKLAKVIIIGKPNKSDYSSLTALDRF